MCCGRKWNPALPKIAKYSLREFVPGFRVELRFNRRKKTNASGKAWVPVT
jgi:hypothetical protein